MVVDLKGSALTIDVRNYMSKFGERAEDELLKQMKKIGQSEVRNTKARLTRSITDQKSMAARVADTIDYELAAGEKGGQLRFGSRSESGSNFAGIRGKSRGDKAENISALAAYGKARADPLTKLTRVKASSKIQSSRKGVGTSTGRLIALPKGYVSIEWKPIGGKGGAGWMETAETNIIDKMEMIPEMLRQVFDEVGQ
tara:strand:+ start:2316 stop:2909 length:594 start_codon:yes stop_codon:yes gene_type:complete